MATPHPPPTQTTTTFATTLHCEGCVAAAQRALSKLDGVTEVKGDVATQHITVTGAAKPADVLAALQKWGAASGREVKLVS